MKDWEKIHRKANKGSLKVGLTVFFMLFYVFKIFFNEHVLPL